MLDAIWQGLISPYTSIRDMVAAGGPAVFFIVATCVVMWTIVIERSWYFKHALPREADAALRTWRARADHQSWKARQIRRAMISRLTTGMSENLLLLRVLVPLCPLLGLLGTVTGMLVVFDSMSLRGSADARTMAAGVSQAMICTLSGLAVSISGLYPVYRFQNRVRIESELLADRFTY